MFRSTRTFSGIAQTALLYTHAQTFYKASVAINTTKPCFLLYSARDSAARRRLPCMQHLSTMEIEDTIDWDTHLLSYIKALPNDVGLSEDNKNVVIQVEGGQPITLPVGDVHKLMVKVGRSNPSEKVIKYLNSFLKEKASYLRDDQGRLNLSSHFMSADKMGELNSIVTVPKSLTDVLTEGMSGTYKPDLTEEIPRHTISVVLQIPKPAETIYTATGVNVTSESYIPYLKYDDADPLTFIIELKLKEPNETVFEGKVTDVQALLALVITLKCYPPSWRHFIWEAWLAVTIQWQLLDPDKEVFPCQWMKQMFYAESLVNLEKVNCLLLGQDPVSKQNKTIGLTDLRKATGVAFHRVGDANPSIKGMKKHYEINCFDDGPIDLCKNDQLLVNMIRTIGINDLSVSKNSYRGAWITYTLKLAHYLSNKGKPIIVFCKFPAALPTIYMPAACGKSKLTFAPHPASSYLYPEHPDVKKVKDILRAL